MLDAGGRRIKLRSLLAGVGREYAWYGYEDGSSYQKVCVYAVGGGVERMLVRVLDEEDGGGAEKAAAVVKEGRGGMSVDERCGWLTRAREETNEEP